MPKKILLADDSITIQKVVELTFSDGDYEVVAVNNGAKAIQKLSELRPDIILSDIIMPERNGYEVCEYVKSHPDLRTIPVVLLTGTFEPFDPDRADKAGCDAVVTKPFESQSLIHKVEELIQQSQASAAPLPASSWIEEPQPETFPAPPPPPSAPVMPPTFDNGAEIFGSAAAPAAPSEMPFEEPATPQPFSAEPSAFESADFGFGGTQVPAEPQAAPAEPSPWEEQPAFGGETRAFPTMSFDDLPPSASAAPSQPETPAAEPSPWDDQPAFGGETRAFPTMSFDELSQAASAAPSSAPEPAPAEPSPWEEQPAFGAETSAFPKMGFDDLPASTPAAEPAAEPSPWDEQPGFGGETRAFEKVSFDDIPRASEPQQETPAEAATQDVWGEPQEISTDTPAADLPWEEQPVEGGETKAFPTMSFDDLSKAAEATDLPSTEPSGALAFDAPPADDSADSLWSEPVEEPITRAEEPVDEPLAAETADQDQWESTPSIEEPASIDEPAAAESLWDEPAPQPWSTTSEAPAETASMPQESFSTAASPLMEQPGAEDMPFAGGIEVEQEYAPEPMPEEPLWAPAAAAGASEADFEQEPAETPAAVATAVAVAEPTPAAAAAPATAFSGELSDEQIEKIARRVVELLTDKVVRDIAWEVIPDTARMIVRDRIRELEAEA